MTFALDTSIKIFAVMGNSPASSTRGPHVQYHPIETQLAGRGDELIVVDRLLHVAIRVVLVSRQSIAILGRRRENHDGQVLRTLVRTKCGQHLEAVQSRQLQIEQND